MAITPRINMGGGGGGKGKKPLAWISFGFGVVGGAALAATFVGGLISGFMGIFPAWVAAVAFVGLFIATVVDLVVDAIPNKLAVMGAILLPSLAQSVTGQLSGSVRDVSSQALDQVNAGLTSWLGVSGSLAVAAVCIVVALLMGRRVLAKG